MPRRYKVAFGGSGGSGKTTLRECLVSSAGDEPTASLPPSPSLSEPEPTAICTWDLVYSHGTTFYSIDTPGSQAFARHRKSFMENLRALVVVYDITSRASYKEVMEWIRPAVDSNSEVQVLLVGNKCDLAIHRQISTDEAQAMANELGICFLETSTKNGQNIKKMHDWIISVMTAPSTCSSSSTSAAASPRTSLPPTPRSASTVPPWERTSSNTTTNQTTATATATKTVSTTSNSEPYYCFSVVMELPKMVFRTLSCSSGTERGDAAAAAANATVPRPSVISTPPSSSNAGWSAGSKFSLTSLPPLPPTPTPPPSSLSSVEPSASALSALSLSSLSSSPSSSPTPSHSHISSSFRCTLDAIEEEDIVDWSLNDSGISL